MTKKQRKYWVITIPEYPSRQEVAQALANYEDNLKKFNTVPDIQSTKIPTMMVDRITSHSFFSKFLP